MLLWKFIDTNGKSRLITRQGRLAAKSCAVVIETDSDRSIRWITPSIQPLLGWVPSTLIGTAITELFHPDDRKSLTTELSEQSLLLRVLRKDRSYHWMKGFPSSLTDDTTTNIGWIFSL